MAEKSFQLFLTADTIAAANASRKGMLDVPTEDENPTVYRKSADETKWRELIVVKDTKLMPSKEDSNTAVFTVQYRVSDDCPYDKNKGKVLTKWYYLNMAAVKNKDHEEYKRANMVLGKLNGLIRGCSVDIEKDENDRVPYHIYFNGEDGGERPLVGKQFWGIIRDYKYKSRKTDEMVNDQDIDNFIPLAE